MMLFGEVDLELPVLQSLELDGDGDDDVMYLLTCHFQQTHQRSG